MRLSYLTIVLVLFCGAQGISAQANKTAATLEIWSWAAPEMQSVADAVQSEFPNVKYVVNAFSYNDYHTKVKNALRAKSATPDLYYIGDDMMEDYFSNGLAQDMKEYGFDPAKDLRGNIYDHAIDLGSRDGKFYLAGWKAAPTVLFYNAAKAKKYFGTDDPVAIGKMTKTWEGFYNFCKTVSEKSNKQDISVFDAGNTFKNYLRGSNEAIVAKDGTINVALLTRGFKYMKSLIDLGATSDVTGADGIAKLYAKDRLFSLPLAPWALQYLLTVGAPESSGQWRSTYLAPSFSGFWGLVVNPFSKNKQLAVDTVKAFTTSPQHMYSLLAPTNDFPVDSRVIDMMKYNKIAFLGGQNPMALWQESAKAIKIGASFEPNSNLAVSAIWNSFNTMNLDPKVTAAKSIEACINDIIAQVPGAHR